MTIAPKELIDAGIKPGPWMPAALQAANQVLSEGGGRDAAIAAARLLAAPPHVPLRAQGALAFHVNITPENEAERANVDACVATMTELVRTPVVSGGAIMPDACPAGPLGTIPVGGVAVSEAIHPGMHSADICCSMALTSFGKADPRTVLDAVHAVTHFGPGGRPRGRQIEPPAEVLAAMAGNPFLRESVSIAKEHFATQGDGNHFAYVGQLKSSGETVLVTHHGSRGPGAQLYKRGMAEAEWTRQRFSPETLKQNAWIKADTREGDDYWSALQIVRAWTKASHFAIHDMVAERLGEKARDRFWNEHNFVFRKPDGLFYHAKGATPAFDGWAADATDLTIIPLNMAEPILIVRGKNAERAHGFSPHGAGRNFSRTQHKRRLAGRTDEEIFAEETKGIDARFFMGVTDISELPSAYKNAAAVRAQIEGFGLAEIVDEVLPYGCIMAGDWEKNAPWRQKRGSAVLDTASG